MPNWKRNFDKLSIYVSEKKMLQKPVERLIKLGEKKDRSVNHFSYSGDLGVPGERGEKRLMES
jgi:hypothetical protein